MPRFLEARDFDQLYEAVVAAGRHVDLPDTNEVWHFNVMFNPYICRDPDCFVGAALQYIANRTPQEARKNEKEEKNKNER